MKHTSALAELLYGILCWPPPVLSQELFPGNLVNCGVLVEAGELAAGVVESAEDNGHACTVTENGGRSPDCGKVD